MVKKMKMLGQNDRILGKQFTIEFGKRLEGFITDFNMFSRFFNENENVLWTTCQSFKRGDVFSWTTDFENLRYGDQDLVTIENTEVDESEICSSKYSYKIEIFWSGEIDNFDAEKICQEMNGEFHLLPETGEELKLLKDAIISYNMKSNMSIDHLFKTSASPWIGGTIRRVNTTKDFYPPSGHYNQYYDRKTGKDIELHNSVIKEMWFEAQTYNYLPEICPVAQNFSEPGLMPYLFTTHKCARVRDLQI